MEFKKKLRIAVLAIGLSIISPAVLFGPAHNVHAEGININELKHKYVGNIPANAVPVDGDPATLKIEEGNVTIFIDAHTGEFRGIISAKN